MSNESRRAEDRVLFALQVLITLCSIITVGSIIILGWGIIGSFLEGK